MKIEILYAVDITEDNSGRHTILAVDYLEPLDRDFLIEMLDNWVFDCEEYEDDGKFNTFLDAVMSGESADYLGFHFDWETTFLQDTES